MSALVTAIPGGTEVLETGSVIQARPGVRFQIADFDLAAGTIGTILTPSEMTLAPNEPGPGDLTVTLPDGTILVFLDMIALTTEGSGLADGDGALAAAWLEDEIEPASGQQEGADPEAGGSSDAVQDAAISELKNFGNVPRGDIEFGSLGPLEQEEETEGLIQILPSPIDMAAADQDPVTPIDPVVPWLPAPDPFAGKFTFGRNPNPSITWPREVVGDDGDNTLPGTDEINTFYGFGGADTFQFQLNHLQNILPFADIITDFEDGIDKIQLNLQGGGPATLRFTEHAVSGAGRDDADTVIWIQETGQILAVLEDVNAANGATINESDITIIA